MRKLPRHARETLYAKAVLHDEVLAYLASRGLWVTYPRDALRVGGVPGILGCYCGKFVAIEVKPPNARGYTVSKKVSTFMARLEALGGAGGVVKSLADVEAILARVYA